MSDRYEQLVAHRQRNYRYAPGDDDWWTTCVSVVSRLEGHADRVQRAIAVPALLVAMSFFMALEGGPDTWLWVAIGGGLLGLLIAVSSLAVLLNAVATLAKAAATGHLERLLAAESETGAGSGWEPPQPGTGSAPDPTWGPPA